MTDPLRVLCLDIEGGFGGSSRSLYESLRAMDRRSILPEVWCRRDGPVRARYEALGIRCRIEPKLPKVSALPRLSRNLMASLRFAREFCRARRFRDRLVQEAKTRFDLLHCNHEGLFLLARWFNGRCGLPITMHVRTLLPPGPFARLQARIIAQTATACIFITENERDHLTRLAGRQPAGTVIYNIAAAPEGVAPHCAVPQDQRLRVAVLSNYAWIRGIDRMIDVAERVAVKGRRDLLFVVAGDMRLRGSLPRSLGLRSRQGGTLADEAAARGVADYFLFLGQVDCPETVLIGCHALCKPTREYNPWGRDILEALAAGKPVLSIGRYDRFVETGVTGLLFPEFDAEEFAAAVLTLADDRALCARLGAAGAERVARLCHGPSRAGELAEVWRASVRARSGA